MFLKNIRYNNYWVLRVWLPIAYIAKNKCSIKLSCSTDSWFQNKIKDNYKCVNALAFSIEAHECTGICWLQSHKVNLLSFTVNVFFLLRLTPSPEEITINGKELEVAEELQLQVNLKLLVWEMKHIVKNVCSCFILF